MTRFFVCAVAAAAAMFAAVDGVIAEQRPAEPPGAPQSRAGDTQAPPEVEKRTPQRTPRLGAPDAPPSAGQLPGDTAKAAAQPPPDTPTQRRRALDDLYAHLAAVADSEAAAPLVAAIERLWLYSGSDTIDVLMERVLKAVAEQNLDLAEKLSDTIVDLEPGFAEGWNRRALVAYLRDDYETALNALRRALALEPNHFKALDGVGHILRDGGDKKTALDSYERLLGIHPYWQGAGEAVDQLRREIEGQGI